MTERCAVTRLIRKWAGGLGTCLQVYLDAQLKSVFSSKFGGAKCAFEAPPFAKNRRSDQIDHFQHRGLLLLQSHATMIPLHLVILDGLGKALYEHATADLFPFQPRNEEESAYQASSAATHVGMLISTAGHLGFDMRMGVLRRLSFLPAGSEGGKPLNVFVASRERQAIVIAGAGGAAGGAAEEGGKARAPKPGPASTIYAAAVTDWQPVAGPDLLPALQGLLQHALSLTVSGVTKDGFKISVEAEMERHGLLWRGGAAAGQEGGWSEASAEV